MTRPLFLALVIALAGCVKDQGPDCGGTAAVGGTWDYHGIQNAQPPGSVLTGTLTVSDVSGCNFSGSMSVNDTENGSGTVTVLTGTFFGVAVSADVVNFDATLNGGTARTHSAEVFGDSMSGTWTQGSGPSVPRGTFWARRTGP